MNFFNVKRGGGEMGVRFCIVHRVPTSYSTAYCTFRCGLDTRLRYSLFFFNIRKEKEKVISFLVAL